MNELKRQAIRARVYEAGLSEGHKHIEKKNRPASRAVLIAGGVAAGVALHKLVHYVPVFLL